MFTYAAATIRSNKRTTLFILALQFVSAYCGAVTFSYWGAFLGWGARVGDLQGVQHDKKYQKYGGEGGDLLGALRFPIVLCEHVLI